MCCVTPSHSNFCQKINSLKIFYMGLTSLPPVWTMSTNILVFFFDVTPSVNFKYFTAIHALFFNSPNPSLQSVNVSAFWLAPPPSKASAVSAFWLRPIPKCADVLLECSLNRNKKIYSKVKSSFIVTKYQNQKQPCSYNFI